MAWWSNQGQDSQWHPEKVFPLPSLDGAVWSLHCFLTLFSVYHRHKQLCSSLLYSSRIATHSCICLHVRYVSAHPPQPKHLCVCACCILFYFTFKILTSWIKCFNKRVEIKLFELIVNLKYIYHFQLSL